MTDIFNIDPSIFAFPVNVLAGLVILFIAWVAPLHTMKHSIIATLLLIIASIVLGLAPASWHFATSWVFIAVILWFLIVLASATLKRLSAMRGNFNLSNLTFILHHAGMWIAVAAGLLGRADMQEVRLIAERTDYSNSAITASYEASTLPFSVKLDDFTVERYPSGEPSLFRACISIDDSFEVTKGTIEVNKPLSYKGYQLYLSSYDSSGGSDSPYCILQIVRQPWKWILLAGIVMMLFGAVLSFFRSGKWKISRLVLFIFLTGVAVYAVFIVIGMQLHSKPLAPALQSAWFVPHITMYMFSYALLGCTFLLAVISIFNRKSDMLSKMDFTASLGVAFFTIGMLFGAVWAKQAWGNYWTWDPKETWAAVAWLGFLLYIHLRKCSNIPKKLLILTVVLSFMALQMCWYGVNYLPSAKESVHTYIK
ncbi:MAG: cytochrome c biogenesis protein CcsA [Bacteroidales bacterium]|nr:cytochrome c biogenesis protein CcsA [Bacteroidales bacterium]MDD3200982.1 cytochrome c biogenesis protein CcsA [Bacteroidales bacterium]